MKLTTANDYYPVVQDCCCPVPFYGEYPQIEEQGLSGTTVVGGVAVIDGVRYGKLTYIHFYIGTETGRTVRWVETGAKRVVLQGVVLEDYTTQEEKTGDTGWPIGDAIYENEVDVAAVLEAGYDLMRGSLDWSHASGMAYQHRRQSTGANTETVTFGRYRIGRWPHHVGRYKVEWDEFLCNDLWPAWFSEHVWSRNNRIAARAKHEKCVEINGPDHYCGWYPDPPPPPEAEPEPHAVLAHHRLWDSEDGSQPWSDWFEHDYIPPEDPRNLYRVNFSVTGVFSERHGALPQFHGIPYKITPTP